MVKDISKGSIKIHFAGGEKNHLLTDIHIYTCILTKTLKHFKKMEFLLFIVLKHFRNHAVDGWMDGWMDGRMDGRTDGQNL